MSKDEDGGMRGESNRLSLILIILHLFQGSRLVCRS
jgi:hypothetical protein